MFKLHEKYLNCLQTPLNQTPFLSEITGRNTTVDEVLSYVNSSFSHENIGFSSALGFCTAAKHLLAFAGRFAAHAGKILVCAIFFQTDAR